MCDPVISIRSKYVYIRISSKHSCVRIPIAL